MKREETRTLPTIDNVYICCCCYIVVVSETANNMTNRLEFGVNNNNNNEHMNSCSCFMMMSKYEKKRLGGMVRMGYIKQLMKVDSKKGKRKIAVDVEHCL